MDKPFDPYLEWLGIRGGERPPDHYRLLGIERFESNPAVIGNAADRQMAHVRTFQTGRQAGATQALLNELAAARSCLLQPNQKAAYDAKLRSRAPAELENTSDDGAIDLGVMRSAPARPATAKPAARGAATGGPRRQRSSRLPWIVGLASVAGLVVILIIVNSQGPGESQGAKPPGEGTKTSSKSERDGSGTNDPPKRGKQPPGNTANPSESVDNAKSAASDPPRSPSESASDIPQNKVVPIDKAVSIAESIKAIQAALAVRDLAGAKELLNHNQPMVKLPEQTAALSRLRTQHDLLAAFWTAVGAAGAKLTAGENISFSNGDIQVEAADDRQITIRAANKRATYRIDDVSRDMPARLAVVLAARILPPDESSSSLMLGLFLAIDLNKPDMRLAQLFCAHALRQGADCGAVLPLLKLKREQLAALDSQEAAAFLAATHSLANGKSAGASGKGADERLAVPDEAARKKALEQVRDVFKKEYSQTSTPAQKLALAKTLSAQAAQTQSDGAVRFALLSEARDLAMAIGDLPLALEMIDQLGQRYRIDAPAARSEAIIVGMRSAQRATAHEAIRQALLEVDQAVTQERFDLAGELNKSIALAARRLKDATLKQQAANSAKFSAEREKQWESAVKAADALKQRPDDPAANLTLGKYRCLIQGEWTSGLMLLAKGTPGELQRAAVADLAHNDNAKRHVELADAWWKLAAAAQAHEKKQLAQRARHWYERALPKLVDLDKTKVERRLQEIKAELAVGDGSAKVVQTKDSLTVPLAKGIALEFRLIPRGEVVMDATKQRVAIARPFYMGVTEITQAQWQAVTGANPAANTGDPRRPVEQVSYNDCIRFIETLNKSPLGKHRFRLPTEAEWEYACRAGTTTRDFFGDDPALLPQYAWHLPNAKSKTQPVGMLKPNPAGLCDMTGNVWELCQEKIARGGCAFTPSEHLNWNNRSRFDPAGVTVPHSHLGLRLVCEP